MLTTLGRLCQVKTDAAVEKRSTHFDAYYCCSPNFTPTPKNASPHAAVDFVHLRRCPVSCVNVCRWRGTPQIIGFTFPTAAHYDNVTNPHTPLLVCNCLPVARRMIYDCMKPSRSRNHVDLSPHLIFLSCSIFSQPKNFVRQPMIVKSTIVPLQGETREATYVPFLDQSSFFASPR